jgi:2'-5' RNA ligase
MRLFIAVTPPDPVLDELETAWAPVRADYPDLRWSGRDSWHVTLAFLGEVTDLQASRLTPRLERAARRHPSFGLSLAGAGAFGSPRRATVLWSGIAGDRRALGLLAASVSAAARRVGVPQADEGRKYHPHLTLARSRDPRDLQPAVDALSDYAGRPWLAGEFSLIRSYLGGHQSGHPRYETLGTWKLPRGGAAAADTPPPEPST